MTERLARRDQDAREIDLTDEATPSEAGDDTVVSPDARPDGDQADRESSGAFEPAEPVVPASDPPAEDTRTGSSIFDVDERAKQEDLNPTGYEPLIAEAADSATTEAPVADPPAEADPAAEADAPVAAEAPAADADAEQA